MRKTTSQVPESMQSGTELSATASGAALGIVPFAPSHLAELEPAPVLRHTLRLFAMSYYRNGPALTFVRGVEVVACVGLAIEGLQAKAWAFLSTPLCRRTLLRLFRAFASALPELKRHYSLDRILVETHPDHTPSRAWLERLGFRIDGFGPRCPLPGQRPLRYVYRSASRSRQHRRRLC